MIKTFCPICKKVHDSTRHCLAEENDTLKARMAELEIQNAGLADQALLDRREAGALREQVAIAKQALEAARPILGYHEYEPWRNEMDAQTAKAASLVRHALDRLNQ